MNLEAPVLYGLYLLPCFRELWLFIRLKLLVKTLGRDVQLVSLGVTEALRNLRWSRIHFNALGSISSNHSILSAAVLSYDGRDNDRI